MGYEIVLYRYGCDTEEKITDAWLSGLDMKMVGGPACSIRDYKDLQKLADRITLSWSIGDIAGYGYKRIWEHPLAGVTSYV